MPISFGIGNLVWLPRPSITEGTEEVAWTTFLIPVRRTGDTAQALSINWTINFSGISSPVIGESVSPASASDLGSGVSGSLAFESGTSQLFIPLLIVRDSIPEPTEYFIVAVTDTSTGTTISDQFAIVDDDKSILAITTNNASRIQSEGTGTGTTEFTFTVSRTGKTSGTCSAKWRIDNSDVDATDFENSIIPSGTVSFSDGDTSKTITIRVRQDSVAELNERLQVSLLAPIDAAIDSSRQSASAQIVNDDGTALAIAATNANKLEGTGTAFTAYTFTVTRTGSTTGTTTVKWAVSGSAISASDFQGGVIPTDILSFSANETSKVITVNVVQDVTLEADEPFAVTLSNPDGGTITTATANGRIVNDDGTALAIAATSANKREGTGTAVTPYTFTVTRTGTTTGTSTVKWAVSGSTINATDFQGGVIPSDTLSFAANETSKVITVNVVQDATLEANEDFAVTLSSPSTGTKIATPTATGTILNDDLRKNYLFANGNSISIPDKSQATSALSVDGVTGIITKLSLTLAGLRHEFANDVDIALVSPTGVGVVLLSDVGGTSKLDNITLKFSEDAEEFLPATEVSTGVYSPTDLAGNDQQDFQGITSTDLRSFNGINPNGTWQLLLRDDGVGDTGSLVRGWILEFTTA